VVGLRVGLELWLGLMIKRPWRLPS